MKLTSLADWNCSIAKTLDVVGEWWTLLILRDAFAGTRRFDDFQASLGLARSVLTARLQKLTDHGILERRAYTQHPPRYEYHLTDKGRALSRSPRRCWPGATSGRPPRADRRSCSSTTPAGTSPPPC